MWPELKIVTIGGGSGAKQVLKALRLLTDPPKFPHTKCKLNAIVSMVDDGGSLGRLRMGLEMPAFGGDIRDTIIGLDETCDKLTKMFNYRFEEGDVKGHSLGNLILAGLYKICDGDMKRALEYIEEVFEFDPHKSIIPVTHDDIGLKCRYSDGVVLFSQYEIDNVNIDKEAEITNCSVYPNATANKDAIDAIRDAHLIILCPGDIYSNLISNFCIPGIKEAVNKSDAKKLYIMNLFSKSNQTPGYTAIDFVELVHDYVNLDYVLMNNDYRGIPDQAPGWNQIEDNIEVPFNKTIGFARYSEVSFETMSEGMPSHTYADHEITTNIQIIKDKLWYSEEEFKALESDVVARSIVRHDPEKIAKVIAQLHI